MSDLELLKEASGEFTHPAIKQPTGFPEPRRGIGITATPGAITGAIIGAMIGKKKFQDNEIKKQVAQTTNLMSGSYYTQVQNVAKHLKVIFTPISVIYVIKDGNREITLDTIEVDEMTEGMKQAFRHQDHMYYRNMMLNKMHSDIQLAEQEFAKKVIEKQMMFKQASDDIISPVEDMTIVEIHHYASVAKGFFESESNVVEKLANTIIESENSDEHIVVSELRLDRPFDKYAGVITNALNTFGLQLGKDEIDYLQGEYRNPQFLANNVQVGFLPDRVIFVVKGRMVSSLPVTSMNAAGFEAFKKQDQNYFKEFFKTEVRKGKARLKIRDQQEKTASETVANPGELFYENDINPVVYFLLLTARFGYEWVDFDIHALIKAIEVEFALDRPISDIAMNKIMAVKAANIGDRVYTSRHAFEKVIRALNNKPIDFLQRENDDLDLEDFVIGIDILERVTPYDNVYDNFSPEVFDYMVSILAEKENYVWGVNITGTEEEGQFISILNYSLLHALNNKFTMGVNDLLARNDIIKENEFILNTASQVIGEFIDESVVGVGEKVRSRLSEIIPDKGILEVTMTQVVKNLVLNGFIDKRAQDLITMLKNLNLYQ